MQADEKATPTPMSARSQGKSDTTNGSSSLASPCGGIPTSREGLATLRGAPAPLRYGGPLPSKTRGMPTRGTGHSTGSPALHYAHKEETHRYMTPSDLNISLFNQDVKFASCLLQIPLLLLSTKCPTSTTHRCQSGPPSTAYLRVSNP